ncbi:YndM family protein [Neobacillus sp. LXY-4]|uniref:YndM family protein n=1 Tax=Neobacillus sp. LXY-4 TaxID=3379826 RepID=UPI003EE30C7C
MKHVRALIIKLVSSFVLLFIILGMIFDMNFGNVLLISLVLGIAAYIVGDMMVLPRTNNMTATMADFGLAFLIIWFISEGVTTNENTVFPSLIAALGVAVFEYFFHKYLANNIIEASQDQQQVGKMKYQTELADEIMIARPDVRSEKDDTDTLK